MDAQKSTASIIQNVLQTRSYTDCNIPSREITYSQVHRPHQKFVAIQIIPYLWSKVKRRKRLKCKNFSWIFCAYLQVSKNQGAISPKLRPDYCIFRPKCGNNKIFYKR